MSRHLNDQYYGGNRLREVGTPSAGTDAANKAYVDGIVEDLVLPGMTFYGYTDTPTVTADKIVTLIEPKAGFSNGSKLLLHFYQDVGANGATITVGGGTYLLTYHQHAITAGIIKAGDKASVVCYNNVAHIVAIDRWGIDMSAAQGTLPSYTGNAGKVLAVKSGEDGVQWEPLTGGAGQLAVMDDNNGNIGLSLIGGSQSLAVTDDDNGNITLTLN